MPVVEVNPPLLDGVASATATSDEEEEDDGSVAEEQNLLQKIRYVEIVDGKVLLSAYFTRCCTYFIRCCNVSPIIFYICSFVSAFFSPTHVSPRLFTTEECPTTRLFVLEGNPHDPR